MSSASFDRAAMMAKIDAAIRKGLVEGAEMVTAEAKARMLLPKHGRKYPRLPNVSSFGEIPGNKSSAPGEHPADQFGALKASITYRIEETEKGPKFVVEAGRGTKNNMVAAWMEYGTIKMAPRLFMRATLEDMRQQAIDIIQKNVETATR